MAVNVLLVFFFNADPKSFRRYLWAYCVTCYGVPMIPAIVLVSIRGDPRGPVFGNAAVCVKKSFYSPQILTLFLAVVLDRIQLESGSSLCLLYSYLDMYFSIHHHLCCRGVSRLPSSEPVEKHRLCRVRQTQQSRFRSRKRWWRLCGRGLQCFSFNSLLLPITNNQTGTYQRTRLLRHRRNRGSNYIRLSRFRFPRASRRAHPSSHRLYSALWAIMGGRY